MSQVQWMQFGPGMGEHVARWKWNVEGIDGPWTWWLELHVSWQGSERGDNGVWQDGGFVVESGNGVQVGVFLKFATQSWNTDDTTGQPV